jgi:hypothetical protein
MTMMIGLWLIVAMMRMVVTTMLPPPPLPTKIISGDGALKSYVGLTGRIVSGLRGGDESVLFVFSLGEGTITE